MNVLVNRANYGEAPAPPEKCPWAYRGSGIWLGCLDNLMILREGLLNCANILNDPDRQHQVAAKPNYESFLWLHPTINGETSDVKSDQRDADTKGDFASPWKTFLGKSAQF